MGGESPQPCSSDEEMGFHSDAFAKKNETNGWWDMPESEMELQPMMQPSRSPSGQSTTSSMSPSVSKEVSEVLDMGAVNGQGRFHRNHSGNKPAAESIGHAQHHLPNSHHSSGASASSSASPETTSPAKALMLVVGHSLSASLLLVVNKWALQVFPFLWILTTLQFLPAVLVVWTAGRLGLAEVDPIDFRKLVAFGPAAGMFFITMTAGNAVVKHSNVDTFIVMRSLVPIPCAFLETLTLGEPCPRPASWVGLGVLLLGAVGYASANRGIAVESSSWMTLFLVMMPVDAVLIKHLINTTGLSQWGLVLYQNLVASTLGVLCIFTMELSSIESRSLAVSTLRDGGFWTVFPVVLSAVLGVSLSYFQMSVRKVVSSTAFMVLGVSNKLLALLINQLAMQANRSLNSIGSVFLSILGAVCFQQTVKGKGLSQAPKASSGGSSSNSSKSSDAGNVKAYVAMFTGLVWAAYLNLSEHL